MIKICCCYIAVLMMACGNDDSGDNKSKAGPSKNNWIDSLERKADQYPDSLSLKIKLGDAYDKAGETDKALAVFEKMLLVDSLNPALHNRKAGLLLYKGDTAGTIATLVSSLGLDDSQEEIWLELGFLYADKKDTRALKIANRLIKVSADERVKTRSRYLSGIYYSNTGENGKALEAFNSCIINDYSFIDAHLEKGILLYGERQFTEALATFEKARAISNTNADAYFWTGKTYEALNRVPEAIEFYKKALGLDGNITEAQDRLNKLEKK
jgi:tetratricopeptide (TPR) repeat protein